MHCLDGLGIIKVDAEKAKEIKNKRIKILNSNAKGFYFVMAQKGWQKKVLASLGVNYILYVYTDYFGGFGEQSSKLFHITMNWQEREKPQRFRTINQGLKALGCSAENSELDEFDTVGLSKYRTNEDFFEEVKKI